jgi:hypothetical protein
VKQASFAKPQQEPCVSFTRTIASEGREHQLQPHPYTTSWPRLTRFLQKASQERPPPCSSCRKALTHHNTKSSDPGSAGVACAPPLSLSSPPTTPSPAQLDAQPYTDVCIHRNFFAATRLATASTRDAVGRTTHRKLKHTVRKYGRVRSIAASIGPTRRRWCGSACGLLAHPIGLRAHCASNGAAAAERARPGIQTRRGFLLQGLSSRFSPRLKRDAVGRSDCIHLSSATTAPLPSSSLRSAKAAHPAPRHQRVQVHTLGGRKRRPPAQARQWRVKRFRIAPRAKQRDDGAA